MIKSQLRQQFLAQRRQLTQNEITAHSHAIAHHFFAHFSLHSIHSIHCFLPILAQNEIDTWLIIKKIWQLYPHIITVTSKTELTTATLSSYILTPDTPIALNRWKVPEPLNAIPFADNQIEMILLPLLCFDEYGQRVGYGKGCYDRFLTQCQPQIIKIGLSLFEPVTVIEDAQPFDQKLNYCITPKGIWQGAPLNSMSLTATRAAIF